MRQQCVVRILTGQGNNTLHFTPVTKLNIKFSLTLTTYQINVVENFCNNADPQPFNFHYKSKSFLVCIKLIVVTFFRLPSFE